MRIGRMTLRVPKAIIFAICYLLGYIICVVSTALVALGHFLAGHKKSAKRYAKDILHPEIFEFEY